MPYMTATIQHMHNDLVDKLDELSQALSTLNGSVEALTALLYPAGADDPADLPVETPVPDPAEAPPTPDVPGRGPPAGKWLFGRGNT